MKKTIQLLTIASMLCAAGCNEVSTDEVTPILTYQTRCGMSGGVPLSTTQTNIIAAYMSTDFTTENDVTKIVNELVSAKIAGQDISDPIVLGSVAQKLGMDPKQDAVQAKLAIAKLYLYFQSIDIKDIVWNSRNIIWLYKVIYDQIEPNPSGVDDFYCACGTDICNKGVGCAEKNNTFVCTAINAPETGQCDPITVDTRYISYIMASHLLPIFQQVATLRSMVSDYNAITKKCESTECEPEECKCEEECKDEDSDKCKTCRDNCSEQACTCDISICQKDESCKSQYNNYDIINNFLEVPELTEILLKDYNENSIQEEKAALLMTKLFYASICECLNGSRGYCPENMQLTIQGAHSSSNEGIATNFYNMIRNTANDLLKSANKKEPTNDEINTFIINQVSGMVNSSLNLSDLLKDPEILRILNILNDKNKTLLPTDINHTTAKTIITILRNMLISSYFDDNKDDNDPMYAAHRQFFGQFVLRSLPPEEKANMFTLTFTQNSRCVDTATAVGQSIGTKQFCHSDMFNAEGGTLTYTDLVNKLLPTGLEGTAEAAFLADTIIMNKTYDWYRDNEVLFEMPKRDAKGKILYDASGNPLKVYVKKFSVYLGDEKTGNDATVFYSESSSASDLNYNNYTLKGNWKSYRCPGGVSCSKDNECGICSNSSVKHWMNDPKTGDVVFTTCTNGIPDEIKSAAEQQTDE